MKKKLMAMLLGLILVFTMTACGDKPQESIENDVDVKYLTTDFVDQLTRDGAVVKYGNVTAAATDSGYTLTVSEKEIVASEDYDEGYYIADRNLESKYSMDESTYIVVPNEDGDNEIISCGQFISFVDNYKDEIFEIYTFGTEAELLVAISPTLLLETDE